MNVPELSLIVVSYNMARELPRTIRTLSPSMQLEISSHEYEVIVVDNGSTQPFPEAECRRWMPDLVLHRMAQAKPSPVAAVNRGLEMARGQLVGVFIDGARMASPRLLRTALEASRLHDRPVIGTLAFHLGREADMQSRPEYDQNIEDELLRSSGWEEDGYRLFDISALAGSSANGWFVLPAESNALFLKAADWQRLGGFDPAFEEQGGGLVNLDTWSRACADPEARVIVLFGEATFHQFHGGVATNAVEHPWHRFHDEYVRIRGRSYAPPKGIPTLVGRPNIAALKSVRSALDPLSVYSA